MKLVFNFKMQNSENSVVVSKAGKLSSVVISGLMCEGLARYWALDA
jgi:hypothetical protein